MASSELLKNLRQCDILLQNGETNQIETLTLENQVSKSDDNENPRDVDFVLVYDPEDSTACQEKNRQVFENNLEVQGLILEEDKSAQLHFVKITTTKDVLCRYAEIMKIRLPMKGEPDSRERDSFNEYVFTDAVKNNINKFMKFLNLDEEFFKKMKYEPTAEFSRHRLYLFDVDNPDFFSQSVRTSIVSFILDRESFDTETDIKLSSGFKKKDSEFDFGINRLLHNKSYKAAYPLHSGYASDLRSKRFKLKKYWAEMRNCFTYQPIDDIKDYFGIKFALYFTWLGFYTYMLIPASLFGLICFMFGVGSSREDSYSNDICNENLNITMCPQCNSLCDYWKLDNSCLQSKITYLFDNNFTVVFAVFMSFWSAVYLEMWKRYSAEVTHKWGLTGFDLEAEHPRPEYLAKLKDVEKRKLNVVTGKDEPNVPFWKYRLPYTIISYSVVFFLICIALGAIFAVIIYKMSLSKSRLVFTSDDKVYKDIVIPVSAAIINLFLITILNVIYDRIAIYLTDLELLRTQTEADDRLTLKIYLFQFINYYSSIFYIAFFKGKYIGHPSDYNKIFGIRQEECSPGGCFHEIFIQLAITMVGRKILAYVIVWAKKLHKVYMNSWNPFQAETIQSNTWVSGKSQWINDYNLQSWPERGLFEEYLEMVLQYGFVTIFVAAFPLAPLCALVVNVFELRYDAMKFLKTYRRPIPSRARNIGVWFKIMDILSRLSALTNAAIIAFTSNFIPRLVYMSAVSPNHIDQGYLNHSLSYFDTADFEFGPPSNSSFGNIKICRYRDYRNPPWDAEGKKYQLSTIYWHIMVGRLAFVVIFQNVVIMVRLVLRWMIPDMPHRLNDQIKREAYLTNDIIIKHERLTAHIENPESTNL